jgi:hypothetical protein
VLLHELFHLSTVFHPGCRDYAYAQDIFSLGSDLAMLNADIVQAVIRLVVARPRLVEMADMDDHNQSRHPRVETQSKKSIKRLKQMRSTILCFPLSPFPHLWAGFQKSPLCIVTSLASFDHHIYRASYLLCNENIRAATRSIWACTILTHCMRH